MNRGLKIIIFLLVLAIIATAALFLILTRGERGSDDGQPPTGGGSVGGGTDYGSASDNGLPLGGDREIPPIDSATDAGPEGATADSGLPAGGGAPQALEPNRLTDQPVSGSFFLSETKSTSSPTHLYYLARETGSLWELTLGGEKPRELNTEKLPDMQEVLWGQDEKGIRILGQYAEEGKRKIWSGLIATSTGEMKETKNPLGDGEIYAVVISPDKQELFYLENINGETRGWVTDWDSGKKTAVFSSSFNGWRAEWPNKDLVTLSAAPAASANGVLYFLNLKNKNFTRALGELKGLAVIANSAADKIIYSTTADRRSRLFLYDLKTKQGNELPIATLAEKCAWSADNMFIFCAVPRSWPAGAYPDDWYTGEIVFQDEVWKLNIKTGETQRLKTSENQIANEFDGENLIINQTNSLLFLINKNTGHMLSFDLQENF